MKNQFLVRNLKTGEVHLFSRPVQAAVFLWGKNVKDWLVYKAIPQTTNVSLIEAMLK